MFGLLLSSMLCAKSCKGTCSEQSYEESIIIIKNEETEA